MAIEALQLVRVALKTGDKKTAQKLLSPLLKVQPSADTWTLAAMACSNDEKAIYCLRQALELQPQHSAANRMLLKLEGVKPIPITEQPSLEALAADVPLKKVKRTKKKRSPTRTLVILSLLVLGVCISTVTMNLAGLITGPITALTELTGGPTPVHEIGGTPIAQVANAPLLVNPSQSKALQGRDADVLEPGYSHEYTFVGSKGADMAIYIQFMSVAASKVSRNVVVMRPDNSDFTSKCDQDAILQGGNNVTLTCTIDTPGLWKVRILGRDKESVGAYFVGVEAMS